MCPPGCRAGRPAGEKGKTCCRRTRRAPTPEPGYARQEILRDQVGLLPLAETEDGTPYPWRLSIKSREPLVEKNQRDPGDPQRPGHGRKKPPPTPFTAKKTNRAIVERGGDYQSAPVRVNRLSAAPCRAARPSRILRLRGWIWSAANGQGLKPPPLASQRPLWRVLRPHPNRSTPWPN